MASYSNFGGSPPPMVVQGQAVQANVYGQSYTGNSSNGGESKPMGYSAHPYSNHTTTIASQSLDGNKPEKQHGCRDVFWAILFYAHLAVMLGLAVVYGPQVIGKAAANYDASNRFLQENNNNDNGQQEVDLNLNPAQIVTLTAVGGLLGATLSTVSLHFMIQFAQGLIKMALIFNIGIFALSAVLSLMVGALPAALMGGLMCAMAAYYAYAVWGRIPFAAANLVTAVRAVQANMGLVIYAYMSLILMFVWSIFWAISAVSTVLVISDCDADGECENEVSGVVMFLFLVSFYWVAQVITNVVHVTVAGTVGTWWWVPTEANGCCSQAVRESYVRALTTSFGSICFGSLIVALIQATKEVIRSMREQGDSALACCAECLLGCIESLVEYFNKWAFVYVGLYGFSFMEAGTNVMTLFRNRGWTAIITDLMVDTVLMMVSLGVGVVTAVLVMLVGALTGLGSSAGTIGTAALFGFLLGYGMASTLFSVVSSAVNTVVVCYAEAPNEFQVNHPELSSKMRDAWRQAYPNDFNY